MANPDPIRVAQLIRKAALLLRSFPGRKGNEILTVSGEMMVAGDLHGHLANFQQLVEQANLAAHRNRMLVLQEFVHGPGRYPGGGDTSHRVLDLAASLVCQYPEQVVLLPGNHELSELTDRPISKDGVGLNDLFARGLVDCYGENATEVASAYRDLIRSMPLAVRTPNRVLVVHTLPARKTEDFFDPRILERHGLPMDEMDRDGSVYALLWGRDVSEENSQRVAELFDVDFFITGHIVCEQGFATPNQRQIIIDCHDRPAAYILLSTTEPLTTESLRAGVRMLDSNG